MKARAMTYAAAASVLAIVLTCASAAAQETVSLYVDPACPTPAEPVTLWASVGTGRSSLSRYPVDASVSADVVRFAVVSVDYDEDAPVVFSQHSSRFTLAPLAAGSYRVELSVQHITPEGASIGSPRIEAVATFTVQSNPPPCAARNIVARTDRMLTAALGEAYDGAFVVEVTDAHGQPAPDVHFLVARVSRSDLADADVANRPDLVLGAPPRRVAPGTYAFDARANDVPGAFQYRAYLPDVPFSRDAYFVVSNRAVSRPFPVVPVVEFYNGRHYFMTASFDEMAKLDASDQWLRTGQLFLAFAPGSSRPADASAVCRFYGRPDAGLDSHFFSASADECDAVERSATGWELETRDAFAVFLPNAASGVCPSGTERVYRAFNNRPDANHRYTTDAASLNVTEYPTGPWIREGYGPEGVAMCAPR